VRKRKELLLKISITIPNKGNWIVDISAIFDMENKKLILNNTGLRQPAEISLTEGDKIKVLILKSEEKEIEEEKSE